MPTLEKISDDFVPKSLRTLAFTFLLLAGGVCLGLQCNHEETETEPPEKQPFKTTPVDEPSPNNIPSGVEPN